MLFVPDGEAVPARGFAVSFQGSSNSLLSSCMELELYSVLMPPCFSVSDSCEPSKDTLPMTACTLCPSPSELEKPFPFNWGSFPSGCCDGLNLKSLDAGTDLQRGLEKYLPCKEVYSGRGRYVILLLKPRVERWKALLLLPYSSVLAAFMVPREEKYAEKHLNAITPPDLRLSGGHPVKITSPLLSECLSRTDL